MSEPQHISVKGARVHNLKNIDVEIPKNKLVVITGKSGSGKSSLAFDTIYAEGQRRYVESLSTYARQFLEQMQKPDVDSLEGLAPAIAIEQKTVSSNPRSTVATITEIYDFLRVLFARAGTPHCYKCGRVIASQTIQEMVDHILDLPLGGKVILLAPLVSGRKGEHKKELLKLQKDGFVRVRIDGKVYELTEEIVLDKNKPHTIDVVVDRLIVKKGIEKRLADSLQTSLVLSSGLVLVAPFDGEEILFSEQHACVECGISYPEISPRTFSFNSPYGACPDCSGLGTNVEFDPDLVVPDPSLSINEGAIACWPNRDSFYVTYLAGAVARHYGFSLDTAFADLPKKVQKVLLYGSGKVAIEYMYEDETRKYKRKKSFQGVLNILNKRYHETDSEKVRDDLARFMNQRPCSSCGGRRLRRESLAVTINKKSIIDVSSLTVLDALGFFGQLSFAPQNAAIAQPLIKEVRERLNFLNYLGLGYLTLDRIAGTLSGGESHRIRLATQLGTRLTGVLYVLDEPSVGLHSRDTERLLATLRDLRDIGNTVIVVEHDEETVLASDFVVDLGPDAGTEGGQVVATGTPRQIMRNRHSLTGQYLAGKKKIPLPGLRRKPGAETIVVCGAAQNNLKEIDVDIPLGLLIGVTGVSGSGKSTLVFDTLYQALADRLLPGKHVHGKLKGLKGVEYIDKVINVDQTPIGRTPRSNPATFTGLFSHIRDIFAKLPESKVRGYKPGRFSFNVKGGRCEACQGDGLVKIEMHFLPDIYVTCDVCQGHRYNRETLEVAYKGRNIADVLDMTVRDALSFFENVPSVRNKLQVLNDVGLDYITLGQQATTLSGGEAQRIKLSRELSKKGKGHTLYILDEPTTGLHFDDVHKLLDVLNSLVDRSNTVLVIEHNLEVVKTADYIIDLGPEGGDEGGYIVACGTPEEIAKVKQSYTGRYLKKMLAGLRK
ncbi:MAG: excinuclease ABC subunit UvrA [Deltaproteobacteria bacterium]|nr:excinuclease ABC subunit UvrA [Deltaproteobacteria bacterium]